MILPGPRGPRQDRTGLGMFSLATEGPRCLPRMIDFKDPLVRIEGNSSMTVDMVAENLPLFLKAMQDPALVDIVCRQHRRSQLSSADMPRVCVDMIFPVQHTELAQFLQLRQLRRVCLPASTFFGSRSMHGDPNAMILEINSPLAAHHYWPLCTQMLAISRTKLLVYTEAATETWTEVLDRIMAVDLDSAATRLKWKPSKNGGRSVATPTATTTALTASRRRASNKGSPATDYVTELAIKGEVGRADAEVLSKIMAHACKATGCNVKEASKSTAPKAGEYVHLASVDPTAPPGRLRLFLNSEEEVRKFYAALHGQTVQVGRDLIAIELAIDMIQLQPLPGTAQRRR